MSEVFLYILLTFIQIANGSKAEVSRGWNLTDILRLGVNILKYANVFGMSTLVPVKQLCLLYVRFLPKKLPSQEQRSVQLNHSLYWNFHQQLTSALIFKQSKCPKNIVQEICKFVSGWFRWNKETPKILSLVFGRVMHYCFSNENQKISLRIGLAEKAWNPFLIWKLLIDLKYK